MQIVEMVITNRTHIIKESNTMLTKTELAMTAKKKIKSLTSDISFFKGLFKDATSIGFPHMWDGNGDLYSKVE